MKLLSILTLLSIGNATAFAPIPATGTTSRAHRSESTTELSGMKTEVAKVAAAAVVGTMGYKKIAGGGSSAKLSDEEIEKEIGISRADHENRNLLNELPNGKIKPSKDDPTIWLDDDGREWKLNAEPNAAYHQPMSVPMAFVRAHFANIFFGLGKVPNLKFISPNADGRYSEICANRYTGELVIDQKIMGTFNLATDAPDAMVDGKLPTTGEHDTLDVKPHEMYGGLYRHVAVGLELESIKEAPVVLAHLDK